MTREEALEILIDNAENGCVDIEEVKLVFAELEQKPCEDAISRKAVIDAMFGLCDDGENPHIDAITDTIERIAPVTPQQKMGRWIYDKNIENWRCSECSETPKTRGYCGSANFMEEHFKYCNHCGAKMTEVEG